MTKYDEMVDDLRERAERFDYDGWVQTAIALENAADVIEELSGQLDNMPQVQIGESVYFTNVWQTGIETGRVSMIQQKSDRSWKFRVSYGSSVFDRPVSSIGKDIFLTRAEAEGHLADELECLNLIHEIKKNKKPPYIEDDPYNQRNPWQKLGAVSSGICMVWEWYQDHVILERATKDDLLAALKECKEEGSL